MEEQPPNQVEEEPRNSKCLKQMVESSVSFLFPFLQIAMKAADPIKPGLQNKYTKIPWTAEGKAAIREGGVKHGCDRNKFKKEIGDRLRKRSADAIKSHWRSSGKFETTTSKK